MLIQNYVDIYRVTIDEFGPLKYRMAALNVNHVLFWIYGGIGVVNEFPDLWNY